MFPSLKHCKEAYQSLIGSIGWLAHSTCPNLIMAHSFLASYSNKPSTGHMNAALHTLHYICYSPYGHKLFSGTGTAHMGNFYGDPHMVTGIPVWIFTRLPVWAQTLFWNGLVTELSPYWNGYPLWCGNPCIDTGIGLC
jgi:hypothetical protein